MSLKSQKADVEKCARVQGSIPGTIVGKASAVFGKLLSLLKCCAVI